MGMHVKVPQGTNMIEESQPDKGSLDGFFNGEYFDNTRSPHGHREPFQQQLTTILLFRGNFFGGLDSHRNKNAVG